MTALLNKVQSCTQGSIQFLYHDSKTAPVPTTYSDPLELLGDLKLLRLNDVQLTQLRAIISAELETTSPEQIWQTRALRKNLIYSFGEVA